MQDLINAEIAAWEAVELENPTVSPMDLVDASESDSEAVKTWRAAFLALSQAEQ